MRANAPIVVLIGPPAAGKTRVGKRIARALEVDFLDTDVEIVKEHGPIPEIFATQGESAFRGFERDAVSAALGSRGVVALGGGAVMNSDTREELQAHTVALITISPDAVAHRLDPAKRPLLAGGLDAWLALVESRRAWYEEVSDATFDASHRDPDSVASDIVQWLEGRSANV